MDEIFDKMIGGEAAIGVYYSGDAITMIDDNPDLAWVFPEEGSVLSVDCMAVPATSEHKGSCGDVHQLHVRAGHRKSQCGVYWLHHPMQKVWDILDEDLKYSEIAYPSEEVEAKEKVFTALSDEVNNELDVKWSEMKSYDEGRQRRCVPDAAACHGGAGLLQHLAQAAQKDPESVLRRKSPLRQSLWQCEAMMEGSSLERKRMNQYTYHTTVLNADGDFRRMIKPSALFRYVEQAAARPCPRLRHGRCFSKRTTRRFWWASRRRRSPGCPCVPKADLSYRL